MLKHFLDSRLRGNDIVSALPTQGNNKIGILWIYLKLLQEKII
ncbi:hypothetical protein [Rickettsia endosymbiont of Polydrusus tereticollis]